MITRNMPGIKETSQRSHSDTRSSLKPCTYIGYVSHQSSKQ